jgi:sRNA-binding regulator protein Hfq
VQDGRRKVGGPRQDERRDERPKGPSGHARRSPPLGPEALARRKRIEELMKKGLPLPLAQAVANGQMSANDAVVRLQRDDEADRISKQHGLPRPLAVQIAMGHADLQTSLTNRRVNAWLEENGARSVFDNAAADATQLWSLGVLGQETRQVSLVRNDRYEVEVRDEAGVVSMVHKTSIKYAFLTDDFKKVRKHLEYDKDLRASTATPQLRPQDRYACSDRKIGAWWDARLPVRMTTVEGEVFAGEIEWFSRYEVCLNTRAGAHVVILRHALADAHEARRD